MDRNRVTQLIVDDGYDRKLGEMYADYLASFNRNDLLADVASTCTKHKRLVSEFSEIYRLDPEHYYSCAVGNVAYSSSVLTRGSVIRDISAKRIFGVLVAAENNEALRKKVELIFQSINNEFRKLSSKTSLKEIMKVEETKILAADISWEWPDTAAIVSYLLLNHYRIDETLATIIFVGDYCKNRIDSEEAHEKSIAFENALKNPFERVYMSEHSWGIVKEIRNMADVFELVFVPYETTRELVRNHKIIDCYNRHPEDIQSREEFERLNQIIPALMSLDNVFQLNQYAVFQGVTLSKSDHVNILNMAARFHCSKQEDGKKTRIPIDSYISVLIMYCLYKQIKETKTFYFDNNSETVFSQVKYFREENEHLKEEVSYWKDELDLQKQQVKDLQGIIGERGAAERQKDSQIIKPYLDEISSLKKKIKSHEKRLEEERAKECELIGLRNFAFESQSIYAPIEESIDLKQLLSAQKVVVIGGHINWRNNLKKKYPSISVMDGHLETADFSVLKNMDFVFLNVSNMSHSVYYKVINILRNSTTPFDYLGRTINQELYEKEMADILLRNEMKTTK